MWEEQEGSLDRAAAPIPKAPLKAEDSEAARVYLQKKTSQAVAGNQCLFLRPCPETIKGKKGRERELIAEGGKGPGEQAGGVSMNREQARRDWSREAGSFLRAGLMSYLPVRLRAQGLHKAGCSMSAGLKKRLHPDERRSRIIWPTILHLPRPHLGLKPLLKSRQFLL